MMKTTTEVIGCLLTVGDELLLGDIPNANAFHIASELRSRGFRLDKMITIGDREEEIVETLCQCLEGAHFLIVTGGLGLTDDDRTCAAVARAFNLPLVTNHEYKQWLQARGKTCGAEWEKHVARMAELPEGAVKLGREMAGFFVKQRDIPCYFLPGVPHEMRMLMAEVVIPDLERRYPHRVVYVKHVLRVQGLMETELNEHLKDLTFDRTGAEIGYLPQVGENWVTLFVAAESNEAALDRIKELESTIISRIGPDHISGHNEESLEQITGQQLCERGWRIAVAESCTGGLLSAKITAIAGASDYFDRGFITYSNQAKVELLEVEESLIQTHGAVSEPVAVAMAQGARNKANVEVGLSITGIAGPTGGSVEKPVGTVFIACATPRQTVVERYRFRGQREHIQQSAAQAALVLLWRILSNDSHIRCH